MDIGRRSLDARVAEMVMGWKDCDTPTEGFRTMGTPPDYSRRGRQRVPAFSAEMGEAWQVVEALREKGLPFRLASQGKTWVASFGSEEESATEVSPARAICLAALKAAERRAEGAVS